MSIIDEFSCECLKSELDLFSVPPTQTAIEQTKFKEFYPISQTHSTAPLEFHITSAEDEYMDLQQSYLYMTVSIRDNDNNVLTAATGDAATPAKNYVFPINYFGATQFKNVEVLLNSVLLSPSDVQYTYRSFLETILSYGPSKKEQLTAGLFYQDSQSPDLHDDSVGENDCVNSGARERYLLTMNSKTFETVVRVHNCLFNQPKLLLSKMDLRLKFHKHDAKYCLMSAVTNVNYKIHIDKAVFYVCFKRVSASVREAHELGLLKSSAKYPVQTTEVKFYTKPTGASDLSENQILTGVLPNRVVLALVSSAAFNGHYHRNPLNFAPFDVRSIQLRRNGVSLPYDMMELDYASGHVLPGYMSLFQGMGKLFHDCTLNISIEDYLRSGMSLYVFDVSQDSSSDSSFSVLQEGVLSVQIKLARALTESATLIVFFERSSLIEINKDRQVSFEV